MHQLYVAQCPSLLQGQLIVHAWILLTSKAPVRWAAENHQEQCRHYSANPGWSRSQAEDCSGVLHKVALSDLLVGCLLTMQVMYECNRSHSETLAEAVPEAMKNVLLVMATQGVLTPAWTVSCSCMPHQDCRRSCVRLLYYPVKEAVLANDVKAADHLK